MVASGSKIVNATFTTKGKECDAVEFSWWEISQSVADNSTVVGWKLELISYQYGYIDSSAKKNWSVTVNGQKFSGTNTIGISANNRKTLASGTTDPITHNSDGTKSFSYSFSQDFKITFNTYVGTVSGSGNGTLTTIARASQPSLKTCPHNTEDVGYLGDTISVHMNSASSEFTHEVRYEFGSYKGLCIDADTGKEATAVTNGFRWTIPKSLATAIPNNDEGRGRIYVKTYKGSTQIGEELYSGFTVKVPSTADFLPKGTLTLTDTEGIYANYGYYVQGLSKIKATVSVDLKYGATLKNCSIYVDGNRYNGTEVTTGYLGKTGSYWADCLFMDSRDFGSGEMYEITVKEYKKPAISKLTVVRCNQDGTANKRGAYLKATFSASATKLVNSKDSSKNNTASYSIKYKKSTASSYTTVNLSALANNFAPTNYTYIFAASISSSYDVVISAWDNHTSSSPTTRSAKGPTGSAIFSWRGFKNSSGDYEDGAGIGKVPEKANALQVGWDAEFDKAVRGKVYGLGTLALIPDGSDLNGYVVPGVYSIPSEASAGTMTNMPKATAGRLVISDSTGTEPSEDFAWEWEYKEQLFLPHDIGRGGVPWVRQIRRQKSTQWTYDNWHTYGLFAYPVGAIYISYTHDDPATLFGGTWVRIVNRFLWAVDENGGMGVEGGEKTHTLTIDEMPSHSHDFNSQLNWDATNGTYAKFRTGSNGNNYGKNNLNTASVGGGKAHNNMPPYIQVSMWIRTA